MVAWTSCRSDAAACGRVSRVSESSKSSGRVSRASRGSESSDVRKRSLGKARRHVRKASGPRKPFFSPMPPVGPSERRGQRAESSENRNSWEVPWCPQSPKKVVEQISEIQKSVKWRRRKKKSGLREKKVSRNDVFCAFCALLYKWND